MSALIAASATAATPASSPVNSPVNPSASAVADALAGLQDVPLPPVVPYTPQTWGWAVLGVLLLALLAYVVYRLVRHYRAQRYRRAALHELAGIEQALQDGTQRTSALAALPALVKRVALAIAPRERVASLSDDAWLQWLDTTWHPGRFTSGPGRLLPVLAYARQAPGDADIAALLTLLRSWIRHHHARL